MERQSSRAAAGGGGCILNPSPARRTRPPRPRPRPRHRRRTPLPLDAAPRGGDLRHARLDAAPPQPRRPRQAHAGASANAAKGPFPPGPDATPRPRRYGPTTALRPDHAPPHPAWRRDVCAVCDGRLRTTRRDPLTCLRRPRLEHGHQPASLTQGRPGCRWLSRHRSSRVRRPSPPRPANYRQGEGIGRSAPGGNRWRGRGVGG